MDFWSRRAVAADSRWSKGLPLRYSICLEFVQSFPLAIISHATGYQYDSIQSLPIGAMRSVVHPASRMAYIMESAATALVE